MLPWSKSIGAITLFAEDLDRAKSFNQDVFDLPIAYEDDDSAVFNFQDASINLLITMCDFGRQSKRRLAISIHHQR